MPYKKLDRRQVKMKPLKMRRNKVRITEIAISADSIPATVPDGMAEIVERIGAARAEKRPVMLAFGAHAIKNGLAPVFIALIREGWVTHLATNGAGIIHDWEFAFQGETSEDVRENVARGEFGNWEETGFYLNLALLVGAFEGRGYGESVGSMITGEGLDIPCAADLRKTVRTTVETNPEQAAAAADLLGALEKFNLTPGRLGIPHPFKTYSVQAAAFELGVPFTGHPMIGHDIIYNHPMNHGGAVGRTALRDFLTFAESVSRMDGGVYLSVGSAVMSPMIFEKSFSMAQNLAVQRGEQLRRHLIAVVDLAESRWDWRQGEPPPDSPDYYLRYNKTFNRMGGSMRYLQSDNREFLCGLLQALRQTQS